MALGIGIVGAGRMASSTLVPYFAATGQTEIAAVFDAAPDAARAFADRHGIARVHDNLDDLVADPAVQAVCISTPNVAHAAPALAALAARKHVFCEKPLASTLDAAREMAAAAEQAATHGVIDAVNFSYRGYPAVRFMRDLLAAGELGEIRNLYMFYAHDTFLDPRVPIDWRLQAGIAGAGPLADLGVHLIDLVRFLCGEIVSVCAQLRTFVPERPDPRGGMATVDAEDAASLLCELEQGAMAAFHVTNLAGGRWNDQHIEIYGARGSLVYERANQLSLQVCIGADSLHDRTWTTLAVPDAYQGGNHGSVQQAFVTSALQGSRVGEGLCPSFADGLRCQEVLDAALTAARERRWIDLPRGRS